MKRTETPAQRIDRLMNTSLTLLTRSEAAELNAILAATPIVPVKQVERPAIHGRIMTDARTGRRYQLFTVDSPTGSFLNAPTGRRYNIVRRYIDLSVGDAVRHSDSGQVGVIVNERVSPTQVQVSLENKTTTVWYVSRLTTV